MHPIDELAQPLLRIILIPGIVLAILAVTDMIRMWRRDHSKR